MMRDVFYRSFCWLFESYQVLLVRIHAGRLDKVGLEGVAGLDKLLVHLGFARGRPMRRRGCHAENGSIDPSGEAVTAMVRMRVLHVDEKGNKENLD